MFSEDFWSVWPASDFVSPSWISRASFSTAVITCCTAVLSLFTVRFRSRCRSRSRLVGTCKSREASRSPQTGMTPQLWSSSSESPSIRQEGEICRSDPDSSIYLSVKVVRTRKTLKCSCWLWFTLSLHIWNWNLCHCWTLSREHVWSDVRWSSRWTVLPKRPSWALSK